MTVPSTGCYFISFLEGLFYYVLGNLRPELRSTHRVIQLIACVECPVLNKYGFERILAPFIRDVNELGQVSLRTTELVMFVKVL